METSSNEINAPEKEKIQLILGFDSLFDLNETRKWTKFFSILGFIGTGFIILAGIGMMAASSMADSLTQLPFPIWIIGLVYVGIGAVIYFPSMFLYDFSANMKIAVNNQDNYAAGMAFNSLKKHFRFIGIAIIVGLAFDVLFIVGVIILSTQGGLHGLQM